MKNMTESDLRADFARAFYAAMLGCGSMFHEGQEERLAKLAVRHADALIAELERVADRGPIQ